MDKKRRIEELVKLLNDASDAYYNGKTELMSDHEWDAYFDELKQLEEETGYILDDSPTNNVSADTVDGQKEEHEYSALSLAKTKKVDDLVKWATNKPIWLSWKLDGNTLVVTYDDGKLTKIVTRGDGHIGTNITHLAKGISGIPETIPYKKHLVIRGEALITYSDFNKYLLESDESYANPRNLSSGTLNLKEPDEAKARNIQWIPFTLVHSDENFEHWGSEMDFLDSLGFNTVERKKIEISDKTNIQTVIDEFTRKVETGINGYPVDGLVITYDDVEYAKTGSITGHHATRAGYAFKWADESVTTTLDHIEWSCATNTITPVAVFKTVELEGTNVSRASLCNISECERLGIGDKGTELEVIKANKIIPKVINVIKKQGELNIPCECPVCNAVTKIKNTGNAKTLECSNSECPAKQLKKYERFVSKAGMNIDGLSGATLQKFINEGWIKSNADILRLGDHYDAIAKLEGFGKKSALNIKKAIENALHVNQENFLYSLSIPMCGKDVSNKITKEFTINEIIEKCKNGFDFSTLDTIGPEKANALVSWFKENDISELLSLVNIKREVKAVGDKLSGMTFVITGDVHNYKNRDELKAFIESLGGKCAGSVSKNTTYLINNDVTSESGKNKKAKELNIPIISEEDFQSIVNDEFSLDFSTELEL